MTLCHTGFFLAYQPFTAPAITPETMYFWQVR